MLKWHLGREGYLIFQPQTKAASPTTNKQEQGDVLFQESQAQLGTQVWSTLSWPVKNMAPALWLFLPPVLWLLPHIFSLFTHPTIPQCSDLRWPRLPVQEWSLTIHLRCERTLPGHAPGTTSRTSHCRASPARPYSTSLTAQPHARHLQPKWQLLPHVYPSGSNCGATSIASVTLELIPK